MPLQLQYPFWFSNFPDDSNILLISPQFLRTSCLSSLAWRWISSNTQRFSNRTVLAKRVLGISAWPCQGWQTSWQFCIYITQSVSWTLSLLVYRGTSGIFRIILKVSNSLLYSSISYLSVNGKNTRLPLSNLFSFPMTGRDGDSNTMEAEE